jgi:hypothetical protein
MDKSYTFKGEIFHGGKRSKDGITIFMYANMDDTEKLPLLVIGKSEKPRYFKKCEISSMYLQACQAWTKDWQS